MSIERILANKVVTRNFVWLVAVSLLFLTLFRLFVLPYWYPPSTTPKTPLEEFLVSTVESLIGTIFISVAGAIALFWLSPPEEDNLYAITSIDPAGKAISKLLRDAAKETSEWIFQGGSGTWLRSETMPLLAKEARVESSIIKLCVQIIDPTNAEAVKAYTDYRRGSDQPDWTVERTQAELLATIVSCAIYTYVEPNLKIELYLRKTFSRFRFDLASKYVVITTADPRAPAIKAPSHSHYYAQYKQDLIQATVTATACKLENSAIENKKIRVETLVEANVDEIIQAANIQIAFALTDEMRTEIVKKVKEPRSKYA
jgi:hypothetical protein